MRQLCGVEEVVIDSSGLRFSHDGQELHAGLEDLRGITVTGSGGRRHGVRARRHGGTTRVALDLDDGPAVWELALDRSEGIELRDQLNIELAGAGLPPLPHIEELCDFEPAIEPVFAEAPPAPVRSERRTTAQQRRLIVAVVALMLFLEIGVPLLILFVL